MSHELLNFYERFFCALGSRRQSFCCAIFCDVFICVYKSLKNKLAHLSVFDIIPAIRIVLAGGLASLCVSCASHDIIKTSSTENGISVLVEVTDNAHTFNDELMRIVVKALQLCPEDRKPAVNSVYLLVKKYTSTNFMSPLGEGAKCAFDVDFFEDGKFRTIVRIGGEEFEFIGKSQKNAANGDILSRGEMRKFANGALVVAVNFETLEKAYDGTIITETSNIIGKRDIYGK